MKHILDSNIEALTYEEVIEYYDEFKNLTNKTIKEKDSFITTYLAYILPIQRMINTYEKALQNKSFYKKNDLLTYREGYSKFLNVLWSVLEDKNVDSDEIFYLGKIGEHISLWWNKKEKVIFNPKTDKMESLDDCIDDCNKYFSNFESEGNRFELLLTNCIGLTLYGMSYCLENNKDCSHYDCNHILYYIYEDLKCLVEDSLEVYKSPLFKEELKALQIDIKNALSSESVDDVIKLREEYKNKFYVPSIYNGEKYSF